jgi:tetratricopeptide (TPR) repeat protein
MRWREHEIVTLLFDLVEGRRDLRTVVGRIVQRLREGEPALDRLLGEREARRAERRREPERAVAKPIDDRTSDRDGAAAELAARERTRAEADFRRLTDAGSAEERAMMIRRSVRGMRSPLLVERLLEEACSVRGASPRRALELADSALLVVRRLPVSTTLSDTAFRLVVRVNACRANLLRILGDLQTAASLWRLITAYRRRHPLESAHDVAELLSLEASLRIDLRQWADAEALLTDAGRIYEASGDTAGAAKVLLQRGAVADYSGQTALALELFRRVADLLDLDAEPVLCLLGRKNEANALVDLGRPAEARAVLAAHPGLLERHGDAPTRLRWQWTEARIDRAEGRFAEAAAGFNEVGNGLLSLGRPYDAALLLLDTAELHLVRGEWREVKRLAGRLEAVFEACGVHLEARKALILFQQAARAESLTTDFIAGLRRYLLVGKNDPRFRFDGTPMSDSR